MCTFENEHSILICDLAIHQVREAVSTAFGDAVQFTPVSGQGTRVEVAPTIDEKVFLEHAFSPSGILTEALTSMTRHTIRKFPLSSHANVPWLLMQEWCSTYQNLA